MRDFTYEIKENIVVLSEKKNGAETLELNRISYGGREAKLDLRRWDRSGEGKMLKGITLTDEEAAALKDALEEALG